MTAQIQRFKNAADAEAFRQAVARGYLVCPRPGQYESEELTEAWLNRCQERGRPCVMAWPKKVLGLDLFGEALPPWPEGVSVPWEVVLYTAAVPGEDDHAEVKGALLEVGDHLSCNDTGYYWLGGVPADQAEALARRLLQVAGN
jgi:hypothetical protein